LQNLLQGAAKCCGNFNKLGFLNFLAKKDLISTKFITICAKSRDPKEKNAQNFVGN